MFEPTGRTQQLVERIKGLSADKRRQMFAKLHEMGIDVAKLPIVPSHPGEPAPLSYAQQRQWFLWQLEPHSSAYHIPSALLLRGVVNVEHLRQSFATLAERHACLRTRFVEANGQVSQQVEAAAQVVIEQTQLHAEGAQREALMRACVAELTAQPFDLLNGPLLRVRLVRLADDEHLLIVVLHHIVTDGWSMSLMVEELMACYAACAQGLAPTPPALPIQYADFAAWQRQWMESGEGERQLGYWKSQLGEIQDVLELPSDHPRPPTMSYRVGNDMVLDQQQNMLVVVGVQQIDPQQRTLAQIERTLDLGRDILTNLLLLIGAAFHLLHYKIQRLRLGNVLLRTTVAFNEGGTQAFMPGQYTIERHFQGCTIERTAQSQRGRNVIGGAFGLQLPEEPLALLRVGQWQRLTAVGGAQCGLFAGGTLTEGQTEGCKGVVFEQGAQRDIDTHLLADTRPDLGRQQGMTAKLEEVVGKPDPLDVQNVLPDCGDLFFQGAVRCDVFTLRQAGIWLWQRLAIELAIGGQRQALEH